MNLGIVSIHHGAKLILLKANTINAAAEEIVGILEGTTKHERNIFFRGWQGLGASTVLRVVAQRLKSSAAQEMKFQKVVHVDCSLWQSMRALQRAIAEELELPQSVMSMFDQHDEEDDFNGIDQGSRGVISDVTGEIFRKLYNSTFVVIFHNGNNHYIDLYECGLPITTFLSNKVLWTWGRRLRLYNEEEEDEFEKTASKADIDTGGQELRRNVLHEEAAKYIDILEPGTVVECFQYIWARKRAGCIDWRMHASNYWICDGIILEEGNPSAWEVGDALERYIYLDWIMEEDNPSEDEDEDAIDAYISGPNDRSVSATHQPLIHDDIGVLPLRATSFLLLADKSNGRRVKPLLSVVMFPDNNRLRVLHLSWCTFSFTSPPFLCCSHLRFLLLDHCTDIKDEEHKSKNQNGSCFQKLWVLDLRYTDWYSEKMMCLMDELRELNVEGVRDWRVVDLCGSKTRLVKLRVEADPDAATEITMHKPVPNMSNANHLKTIILESCVGLEQVVPDVLPPLLESFSFTVDDDAIAKISSISFQGLAKLKSVLLRGLMESLEELDLSGTAVKTLDLREVVARNLKQLIMLGCQKLQAIQWPRIGERPWWLEVLRVDTVQSGSSGQGNCEEKSKETIAATGSSQNIAVVAMKQDASFDKYIYVRDGRLLRSLVPVRASFELRGGHMEMSSSPASSVAVGDRGYAQRIRHPDHYLYARDIVFQYHLHVVAANEGAIRWMWACPPAPVVDTVKDWYVHIQVEEGMKKSGLLKQEGGTQGTITGATSIPDDICRLHAKMLHVHDCLSITSIPVPRDLVWTRLEQCRVERCPNISSVFAALKGSYTNYVMFCFYHLTTFWASQLLMARYIWNWNTIWQPSEHSFRDLEFLHLDYCPRLIHVLPLSVDMTTLPHLVTLEIVCCGDIMEIFPLDPERQEKQTIINFPELKHIHLHDLPRLQHICGSRMLAPKLETIKIRGCWSLKRLPAVAKKFPKVDCEKDWWDSLEWHEGDVNHHPSLYKPTHSRYYKKSQLPRGSVLR
ncbi:unnamed protein product [Triticum turgidum subsp. durum]|uniref:Disease resistance protein At4g27190-like leucine-rich repeats domain-containing protein n=1 Tax=Triticum turgidum subsp. durum TaxID=4567 RepID=A0A9R0Z1N4_TRITD|nr:unnamed protein product [Triticum turgidum subsp. durum]